MTTAIDHLRSAFPVLVADDAAIAGVAPVAHVHVNTAAATNSTDNRHPRANYARCAWLRTSAR